MSLITVRGHFDGERILLDEPVTLDRGTPVMVTILPAEDQDRAFWYAVSSQSLARAYGAHEPEYTISSVREPNPEYDRG